MNIMPSNVTAAPYFLILWRVSLLDLGPAQLTRHRYSIVE